MRKSGWAVLGWSGIADRVSLWDVVGVTFLASFSCRRESYRGPSRSWGYGARLGNLAEVDALKAFCIQGLAGLP